MIPCESWYQKQTERPLHNSCHRMTEMTVGHGGTWSSSCLHLCSGDTRWTCWTGSSCYCSETWLVSCFTISTVIGIMFYIQCCSGRMNYFALEMQKMTYKLVSSENEGLSTFNCQNCIILTLILGHTCTRLPLSWVVVWMDTWSWSQCWKVVWTRDQVWVLVQVSQVTPAYCHCYLLHCQLQLLHCHYLAPHWRLHLASSGSSASPPSSTWRVCWRTKPVNTNVS